MYAKTTPEQWIRKLLDGQYASSASARKSIAKTEWPDRIKERARHVTEQYFTHPGTVAPEDITRRGFRVSPKVPVTPIGVVPLQHEPDALAIQTNHATARLMGCQHAARCCKEFLEVLQLAHHLYPEYDISNGQIVLDKVLVPALVDFVQQAAEVLTMPKLDTTVEMLLDAPPSTVPPIEANYTPEQKAVFDRTVVPVDPFQKKTTK